MLAFIRGTDTFLSSDQIYVKLLPNGEAKRVSDDIGQSMPCILTGWI